SNTEDAPVCVLLSIANEWEGDVGCMGPRRRSAVVVVSAEDLRHPTGDFLCSAHHRGAEDVGQFEGGFNLHRHRPAQPVHHHLAEDAGGDRCCWLRGTTSIALESPGGRPESVCVVPLKALQLALPRDAEDGLASLVGE